MIKKKKLFPVICIVFCILYIILSLRPLSKELHLSTKWTVSSARATVKNQNEIEKTSLIPFKTSQNLGYFTENGEIYSSLSFPYKAVITKDYYAFYGTHDKEIKVYSSSGNQISSIKIQGFPYFTQNDLYVMLPGGQSFVCLDEKFNEKYRFENYSPITSFSSSKSGTIAGFADGNIICFDKNGKIFQQYKPGGSEYNIILGAALSDSGTYSACVSGQNRQRFVLAKKDNALTTIIFHEYLDEQMNNQALVKFSEDETKCYFAFKNGLGIVDLKNLKSSHLKVKGKILSIYEAPKENCTFVLSKIPLENENQNQYFVSVIENFDNFNGSFSFKAKNAFIKTKENILFVGKDETISRIEISHK